MRATAVGMAKWMLALLALTTRSTAFISPSMSSRFGFACRRTLCIVKDAKLPSPEQLSSDPFMKQVSHASALVDRLSKNGCTESKEEELLTDLLSYQLSHPDGIRGFFVTYLTSEGTTAADGDVVPKPVETAMRRADREDLVPLACMNLIMPTAMVTMHTDSKLSAQSAKTAQRGKRVLTSLKDDSLVVKNCEAIKAAISGDGDGIDDKLVKYWQKFYENYGYKEEQKEDIAKAFSDVVT